MAYYRTAGDDFPCYTHDLYDMQPPASGSGRPNILPPIVESTSMDVCLPRLGPVRGRRRSISTPSELQQTSPGGSRPPLLLRRWLIDQTERRTIPGLEWMTDPDHSGRSLLRIPWRHGSRSEFNGEADGLLFRAWAHYKGRDVSEPRYKDWKRNFRCALNSLKDVTMIRPLSKRSGPDAFVVYEFQPELPKKRDGSDIFQFTKIAQLKTEEESMNSSDDSENGSDPSNSSDLQESSPIMTPSHSATDFDAFSATPAPESSARSVIVAAPEANTSGGSSAGALYIDTPATYVLANAAPSDASSPSLEHCSQQQQMCNSSSSRCAIYPFSGSLNVDGNIEQQQGESPTTGSGVQRVLSPARAPRPSAIASCAAAATASDAAGVEGIAARPSAIVRVSAGGQYHGGGGATSCSWLIDNSGSYYAGQNSYTDWSLAEFNTDGVYYEMGHRNTPPPTIINYYTTPFSA